MTNNVVSCPSCGKKYKRPERADREAVKVKCKQCGNVFVIKPPSEKNDDDGYAQTSKDWLIKKANGDIVRAKNYTDIQLLIVKKEIHETDEMSQTGSDWKKLSEIETLKPFFEALKESEKTEKIKEVKKHLKIDESPVITPDIKKKEETIVQEKQVDNNKNNLEENTEESTKEEKETPKDKDFDALFMNDDEIYAKESKNKLLVIIIILVVAGLAGAAYYFMVYSKNSTDAIKNKTTEHKVEEVKSSEPKPVVEKVKELKEAVVQTNEVKTESKKIKQVKVKKPVKKKTLKKRKKISKWKTNIKRGWRFLDKGNLKASLKYFNTAIKENPSASDAYFGLGETYNAMGNKAKAKLNYKKFLTFKPNAKDKNEVENILKNL